MSILFICAATIIGYSGGGVFGAVFSGIVVALTIYAVLGG